MKKDRILPIFIGLALGLSSACSNLEKTNEEDDHLITYVDPFIGTGAHGHTFPGATVPFGMVQLSPDNGSEGWDWCSGYHYSDSIIVGFSHTHLSGTGIGDLADISMMPTTVKANFEKIPAHRNEIDFKSSYTHEQEEASPGFYKVKLLDQNILVSLTATNRCGFQKYEFSDAKRKSVILNLAYSVNWDSTTQSSFKIINDTLATGYRYSTGWAKDQRVYFAIAFSEPSTLYQVAEGAILASTEIRQFEGGMIKAQFDFISDNKTLLIKTGLSSGSEEGAIKSLTEIKDWDFERVKTQAAIDWEDKIGTIIVKGGDQDLKETFYTALYHTKMAPVTYSDLNGAYKATNANTVLATGYTRYDIFSLWDTYRAAHPLFTILEKERIDDMINSMLAHHDEYGLLPVWSLLGNETNTMTGYHAIPVITDAYFKGFKGFDQQRAYEAMKKSAMQDIRGVQFYKQYGFIPSDLEVESVTKNLEYAYDDWCIAQVAKSLGYNDDFDYFSERSQSFRLLYDSSVGFMRGKLSNGAWREPFDPKRSEHRVNTDYTEGNAWQHTWYVPHDVPSLIKLMGGKEDFVAKLDSLFTISSEITGDNVSSDISGLIGQYAHGNEPSHHVAYLYNYAKAPWKTQQMVRKIMHTQYNDTPEGLCGNDDCGQMSAWYVFSALGFYPVNPANGIYMIGSPLFDEAAIQLSPGKTFTIVAKNNSKENMYIQSAMLNGQKYGKPYLSHEDIVNGGNLVFEMGSEPSKWGTKELIPEILISQK